MKKKPDPKTLLKTFFNLFASTNPSKCFSFCSKSLCLTSGLSVLCYVIHLFSERKIWAIDSIGQEIHINLLISNLHSTDSQEYSKEMWEQKKKKVFFFFTKSCEKTQTKTKPNNQSQKKNPKPKTQKDNKQKNSLGQISLHERKLPTF